MAKAKSTRATKARSSAQKREIARHRTSNPYHIDGAQELTVMARAELERAATRAYRAYFSDAFRAMATSGPEFSVAESIAYLNIALREAITDHQRRLPREWQS